MKIIPIIRCKNMAHSISFYTEILDFKLKYQDYPANWPVINLVNDGAELQLSHLSGDSVFGVAINIRVNDVDALFDKYIHRGLDTSAKLNSPVHQKPTDQNWGVREFYITDPDGNTLRFGTELS